MFYNSLTDNSLVSGISDLGNWIGGSLFGTAPATTDINNYMTGPFTGGTSYNEAINNGFGKPNATPVVGNWNSQNNWGGISNTTDGLGLNIGTFKTGLDVVQGIGSLYGAWSQNKLAKQALNQAKNQFYYNMAQDAKNFNAAAKTYNNDLAQKYETAAVQNTGNSHAYDDKIADRRVTG